MRMRYDTMRCDDAMRAFRVMWMYVVIDWCWCWCWYSIISHHILDHHTPPLSLIFQACQSVRAVQTQERQLLSCIISCMCAHVVTRRRAIMAHERICSQGGKQWRRRATPTCVPCVLLQMFSWLASDDKNVAVVHCKVSVDVMCWCVSGYACACACDETFAEMCRFSVSVVTAVHVFVVDTVFHCWHVFICMFRLVKVVLVHSSLVFYSMQMSWIHLQKRWNILHVDGDKMEQCVVESQYRHR